MQQFALKKGLDIPVLGAPAPGIQDGPTISTVAVLGDDYIGIKPRLEVAEGDAVVAGTPLFADKDIPDVKIVAPVSGTIKAINRGERRKLIGIEISVDENPAAPLDFLNIGDETSVEGITAKLCAAGLWTSFRTRPYSKIAEPGTQPTAIFITATDTEPLAADPAGIIATAPDAFAKGVEIIAKLSDSPTYLCHAAGADLPGAQTAGVIAAEFSGPHPAGLAGTHIHFLAPPTSNQIVWTVGYQDVITIGTLFSKNIHDATHIVALTGPACANPRTVRTIAGASLSALLEADMPADMPVRMISGSILSGRLGEGPSAYLGRYARQATLIEEDKTQIPLGWIRPMASKYAFQPVLGSAIAKKLYPLTSNLNGGRRAMVPLGTFEALMPQDYMPTQLLRALLVMDTDQAQALGALELDEEDLGLVGFACPAKYEYGLALRDVLNKIEKEG